MYSFIYLIIVFSVSKYLVVSEKFSHGRLIKKSHNIRFVLFK